MWFTNNRKTSTKAIFLDIDEVLTSKRSVEKRSKTHKLITRHSPDMMHIKHLNRITKRTGAIIIISSTWRKQCNFRCLASLLLASGVKGDIVDTTPIIPGASRGQEIQSWLTDTNLHIDNFIILDDSSDMDHLTNRHIKIDGELGLTKKNAHEAIVSLNNYH